MANITYLLTYLLLWKDFLKKMWKKVWNWWEKVWNCNFIEILNAKSVEYIYILIAEAYFNKNLYIKFNQFIEKGKKCIQKNGYTNDIFYLNNLYYLAIDTLFIALEFDETLGL